MNRSRCWIGLIILAAVLPLVGCTGGSAETPKPKPPAVFDPQDAESTFRWLLEQAKPVRDSGKLSHQEQMNNPLRKDHYNQYQRDLQRWNEMLRKLVGTQVVWLTQVGWINEQGVQVDCTPRELSEDDIKVKARFAEYPQYRMGDYDGKLLLGQSISLEEAKRLDRGGFLWVQGVIERIESSVDGEYGDYVTIYVNQTRALLPQESRPQG
jgi:hypothetical protein